MLFVEDKISRVTNAKSISTDYSCSNPVDTEGLIICAFLFHIWMADLREYNLGVRHSFIYFKLQPILIACKLYALLCVQMRLIIGTF